MNVRSAFLLVAVLMTGPAMAQERSDEYQPLFEARNKKYDSSLEKFYQERSLLRNMAPQVLDSRIDPEIYRVGPGDGFSIFIWGGRDDRFEVVVYPLGTVVIPTVGEIDVGGLKLQEALDLIQEEIRANYENIRFSVNLTQLRRFRVYVAGEISSKGTYFVQGSDRLSDIIALVGGVSRWGNDTAIEIRHLTGETDIVDLSAFFVSGDRLQNPTLAGGDIIYVPPINLKEDHVFFEGTLAGQKDSAEKLNRILRPEELPSELQGIFPLKENELLQQFLLRIGAVEKNSDLEQVMVFRGDEEIRFNVLQSEGVDLFLNFQLVNKDRVVIKTRRDRVYVRGEVRQPGAYPYLADRTTSDYAGVAGVMDTGAYPDSYEVIRAGTGEKLRGKGVIVFNGDTVLIPQRRRENFKDYVQILLPVATLIVSVAALTSR